MLQRRYHELCSPSNKRNLSVLRAIVYAWPAWLIDHG